MGKQKKIGIIGGMGPMAGADLFIKVLEETVSSSDNGYIPTVLLSKTEIEDRTSFILGDIHTNPAHRILEAISELHMLGVEVVGIPCNSSHAFPIWSLIVRHPSIESGQIKLLSMIDELSKYLIFKKIKKVMVLCTLGSFRANIFGSVLPQGLIEVHYPELEIVQSVHQLIYEFKADKRPIKEIASSFLEVLQKVSSTRLPVVLGCTELPLIASQLNGQTPQLIDPTRLLARALVKEADHRKLRKL